MEHFNALYDYYREEGHGNHTANNMALKSIQTKDPLYVAAKEGEL